MISIWDPKKPGLEFMASVSYIIPLVISVIWNFTFNRKFTFKSATNVPKSMALAFLFYVFFAPASLFLQAFLVNGIVLSESVLVIPCLNDLCGWAMPELLATIICMLLNFALEFLWQRYVVFRNSIDSNKNNNKK
ncbi:MAG: GtrA family protein [Bacilli bacterium]|nr:GtrA family protein [Bacilli bacterium]